jgi:uncharacterized protein YecE (DUF72 family)
LSPIRVGFSGWTYAPWRGIFYPSKLTQKKELAYAAERVTSIEINGTFYRLQKPESFQAWYDQVPDDFVFAIKANQYVTHRRRLKDVMQPLANFFASGLLALKHKLGPILWQFPPNLPLVDDRFETFMKALPHTSREAEELAKRHDDFVAGKCVTDAGGDYPVRHAFEFRHPSFRDADFLALMRRHNIAVVIADAGEHSLELDDLTADHVYLRMHGQAEQHLATGYSEAELKTVAKKVTAWAEGKALAKTLSPASRHLLPPAEAKPRPVFVYFDNDAKALAPQNAMRLLEILDAKAR